MSELVEKVRGIIETHIAACEPPDAIARAAIAAVAKWLEVDVGTASAYIAADNLCEQLDGTHGSPELDDDARKLAALGQDPGPTFATDPAPVVCEWTDHGPEWISTCKHRFGAFASTKGRFFCPGCGGAIKFTEAAHDKELGS